MSDGDRHSSQGGEDQAPREIRRKRNFRLPIMQRDKYMARFGVRIPSPAVGKASTSTAAPSATVGRPGSKPTATPLQPQWDSGITLKKGLKGDEKKKTCLITVGGTDYVVKGAPRPRQLPGSNVDDHANASTAGDNAEAATLIRGLGLQGVRAPQIRVVEGQERDEVIAALQDVVDAGGPGAHDALQLIRSFDEGDVQLSGADPGGVDLDKVFLDVGVGEARAAAVKIRRDHASDPEAAWTAGLAAIYAKSAYLAKIKDLASDDPVLRKKGVKSLSQNNSNPIIDEYLRLLEDIVDGQQAEGLRKAEADAAEREQNQGRLRDFVKSPEGVTAFAGVAVADLVSGMDDRIMGDWNGGNFMFDSAAGELACIDNNKRVQLGLGAPDNADWNSFFMNAASGTSGSLADAIYAKIFEPDPRRAGLSNDKPPQNCPAYMPGLSLNEAEVKTAKETVRRVLDDAIKAVEDDDAASPAAKARVAVMKELMLLQDFLSVPPELTCPGSVEEPSAATKFVRGVKALGSDWFADADKIKSNLRTTPTQYAKARTDLQALIAKHPKDSKGGSDRLAKHILFLATASEFGEVLGLKATALDGFANKTTLPADETGEKLFNSATRPFSDQAALWQDNLKSSDGAIAALIARNDDSYKKACAANKDKYLS